MSDKAMRNFVLCYLLGEWVAGVVLNRRDRQRIRRDAEIQRAALLRGKQIGFEGGYQRGYERGYLDAGGMLVYVARTGRGKSLIAAGDARVPRSRRYR
jgi:hypothetical protein